MKQSTKAIIIIGIILLVVALGVTVFLLIDSPIQSIVGGLFPSEPVVDELIKPGIEPIKHYIKW